MMNILGQLLLWAGFLGGALATVMNLEVQPGVDDSGVEVGPWDTISWTWYLTAVGICMVGILLIRLGKWSAGQQTEASAASLSEIRQALERLIDNLDRLDQQLDSLAPSKMTAFIDDVLAEDLRIFAEGRESISTEFGLQRFADVMSQFAAGERAINRAWSAAADGYVDETKTCIERGLAMMKQAREELQ